MSVYKEYEIYTADGYYATVMGPELSARNEVRLYLMQLGPDDGKVVVYEIQRKEIDPYDDFDPEPTKQGSPDSSGGHQTGGCAEPPAQAFCH